jgi:hypothetical protein
MDTNAPLALIAASYSARVGAVEDVSAVWAQRQDGEPHHTSIAVLDKDPGGTLHVARSDSTPDHLVRGGALLGGALFVVAPVAGAEILASTGLSGVGVIVEHIHRNTDAASLAETAALLQDGSFGLVVVVLNCGSRAVSRLLSHADRTIAIDMPWGDLDAELSENPAGREPPVVLVAR